MATRNIVPRANGEGSVGTAAKKWGNVQTVGINLNGFDVAKLLLLRKNGTAYEYNNIAVAKTLPAGLLLHCTTGGTTDTTEPDCSNVSIGDTVNDGTVVWTVSSFLGGGVGHSIGEIFAYVGTTQPPGALLCDHSAVSRTMYAKLFSEIGTTYGAGDGSTTFNLPSAADARYLVGSTTAGQMIDAGLPNIEGDTVVGFGTMANTTHPEGTHSGTKALYKSALTSVVSNLQGGTTTRTSYLTFDASDSNPIYGNSDTVTPKSLSVKYYIQAFNASTDPALVDLTQILQDLANKLTREQTPAVNKRDVVTVSGTYTAPVTGWYRIEAKGGGGGGQGGASTTTNNFGGAGGGEGGLTIGWEHLTVGDSVTVVIGAGGAGGAAGGTAGNNGGNTTATANNNNYTGSGGSGAQGSGGGGGAGGIGTVIGNAGSSVSTTDKSQSISGASGGGAGGGVGAQGTIGGSGFNGGGGAGGGVTAGNVTSAGGNGGDGYAAFEYFAAS